MRIVADSDIPFLKGVLEPYSEVSYQKGADISPASVKDADALLVRTRTRCDAALLEGSSVKLVCTATIGTDHLDTAYLRSHGISFASAPGCNAGGVMQYVWTALLTLCEQKGLSLAGKTMGVIGVGHTGGRVARLAEYLGMKVLRCDPPRALAGGTAETFCGLKDLLENSDVITCHVPLDDTTYRMADVDFFASMKEGAIFINASRGEVVEDEALLNHHREGHLSGLVLDVWNGEPSSISPELVSAADIATPHIAGYSCEGKVNGTAMAVQALASFFSIAPLLDFIPAHLPPPRLELPQGGINSGQQSAIADALLGVFPILDLDSALRESPASFERIRSSYPYRHEFKY